MKQKAYLVLSVKQIEELARAARADMKAAATKNGKKHCIVLRGLELNRDSEGELQIGSYDVSSQARQIHYRAAERISLKLKAASLGL